MAAAALTRVLPRARLRSAGLLATRAQSTIVYHALPTPDVAREMPRHVSDLTNETLYMLSMSGSHEAVRERLRREIMFVDGVGYTETTERIREMNEANNQGLFLAKLPFQLGIWSAVVGGWASLPLVFHLKSAEMFNDYFVTADHPQPDEGLLQTPHMVPCHTVHLHAVHR